MKKILAMAVALFATVSMFAQDGTINIIPRIGYSVGDLTSMEDYGGKPGFVGGVDAQYFLSDKFAISAGLFYSMQGAECDVTYSPHTKDAYNFKDKWALNYLNIPLMAQYYVYKGLAVKAGVQPGILLSAESKVEDADGSASVDIKNGCEKVDLSIPVGLSVDIKNFVIDARYNFGLTGVSKSVPSGEKNPKNSVFQLTVGYKFAL